MNRQYRKFWSLVLMRLDARLRLCAAAAVLLPRRRRSLALPRRRHRDRVSGRRRAVAVRSAEHAAAADAQEHRKLRDLGPAAARKSCSITLCNSQVMRQLGGRDRVDGAGNDFAHAHQPGGRAHDLRSGAGRNGHRPFGRLAVPRLRSGSGAERIRRAARCQRVLGKEPTGRRTGRAAALGDLRPPILRTGSRQLHHRHHQDDRRRYAVRRSQQHDLRRQQHSRPPRSRPLHQRVDTRTSKPPSAIRCCKAAARNTTASPAR